MLPKTILTLNLSLGRAVFTRTKRQFWIGDSPGVWRLLISRFLKTSTSRFVEAQGSFKCFLSVWWRLLSALCYPVYSQPSLWYSFMLSRLSGLEKLVDVGLMKWFLRSIPRVKISVSSQCHLLLRGFREDATSVLPPTRKHISSKIVADR